MSNATMISMTSIQVLLTVRTKKVANEGIDYEKFVINLLVSASFHRFEIQFIIIALKSVYGIEQLVNGVSYALDVLRILLNVNRWVEKLRNFEMRSKTRRVLRYVAALSSFITYHWACNKNNMTGATSGAGTGFTPYL